MDPSKLRDSDDGRSLTAADLSLSLVPAETADLGRYIDFMEQVTDWLATRGIEQWPPGIFRTSADYYAASIELNEVYLAFIGSELVGTIRILLADPIVWPEVRVDDSIYVYNLAVKRARAGLGAGSQMLQWAGDRARSLGRDYVRLDCFDHNAALRRYYDRAGFADRGAVDARYPDPIGMLRLRRFEKLLRSR